GPAQALAADSRFDVVQVSPDVVGVLVHVSISEMIVRQIVLVPRPLTAHRNPTVRVEHSKERAVSVTRFEIEALERDLIVAEWIEPREDRGRIEGEALAVTRLDDEHRRVLQRMNEAERRHAEAVGVRDCRDAPAVDLRRRLGKPLAERKGSIRDPRDLVAVAPPGERPRSVKTQL